MRVALTAAALLALASATAPARAQDCTPASTRAQPGTLASPAPPCKAKPEPKAKPLETPSDVRARNDYSGVYVGGSIGTEFSVQRRAR